MASIPSPTPAITLDSTNLQMTDEEPPLSPLERRETLEKHMQLRPEAQDLKNRNILYDSIAAPSLQAKQHELERQRASDTLKKGLLQRSERSDLEQRNILPTSPTRFSASLSPSLQPSAHSLERHMRRDSLEQRLAQRPAMETLVERGVLSR